LAIKGENLTAVRLSLCIIVNVPHVLGDYIEIEMPINKIKKHHLDKPLSIFTIP
jgi:hypothetical protein